MQSLVGSMLIAEDEVFTFCWVYWEKNSLFVANVTSYLVTFIRILQHLCFMYPILYVYTAFQMLLFDELSV